MDDYWDTYEDMVTCREFEAIDITLITKPKLSFKQKIKKLFSKLLDIIFK